MKVNYFHLDLTFLSMRRFQKEIILTKNLSFQFGSLLVNDAKLVAQQDLQFVEINYKIGEKRLLYNTFIRYSISITYIIQYCLHYIFFVFAQ